MQPRAAVLLAALLATAPALAGCLARSANADTVAVDDGFAFADAVDLLPVARESAAASYRSDAFLVSAFATEGQPVDLEDPPFLFDSRADAAVGDGRALVWTFAFRAPNATDAFFVAVDATRAILYARALSSAPHAGVPHHGEGAPGALPAEPVGSVAAAAAVAAHEKAARFLKDHPVSAARLVLATDDRGPAWIVMRHSATGFGLFARVDATTGALTEVRRFPDDLVAPCPDCRGDPVEPPATPPPDRFEKTMRLDAFNREASFEFEESHWGFLANVTVVADAPGSLPVEARTLRLYDGTGMLVDEATGTGRLEVVGLADEALAPFRHHWRVTLSSDVPPVAEEEVPLVAEIAYGRWIGDKSVWADGGGGAVSVRQTAEHAVPLQEGAERVLFRIDFYGHLPLPPDASWELADSAGNVVAAGDGAGGEARLEGPVPSGALTLRVTGGDSSVFGVGYQYLVSQTLPAYWH